MSAELDQAFRDVLRVGAVLLLPVMLYFRIRSRATGERLDRWQEGRFILFTLRPIGLATMLGLVLYLINPRWMQAANALAAANWFLWLGGTLVVILLVVRTPIEEAHLLRRFGEPYRAYVERTGRFLPKTR